MEITSEVKEQLWSRFKDSHKYQSNKTLRVMHGGNMEQFCRSVKAPCFNRDMRVPRNPNMECCEECTLCTDWDGYLDDYKRAVELYSSFYRGEEHVQLTGLDDLLFLSNIPLKLVDYLFESAECQFIIDAVLDHVRRHVKKSQKGTYFILKRDRFLIDMLISSMYDKELFVDRVYKHSHFIGDVLSGVPGTRIKSKEDAEWFKSFLGVVDIFRLHISNPIYEYHITEFNRVFIETGSKIKANEAVEKELAYSMLYRLKQMLESSAPAIEYCELYGHSRYKKDKLLVAKYCGEEGAELLQQLDGLISKNLEEEQRVTQYSMESITTMWHLNRWNTRMLDILKVVPPGSTFSQLVSTANKLHTTTILPILRKYSRFEKFADGMTKKECLESEYTYKGHKVTKDEKAIAYDYIENTLKVKKVISNLWYEVLQAIVNGESLA